MRPASGWREQWAELLGRRRERIESAGIAWIGHVAPDKEAVYPEMLPAGVEPAAERPIDGFLAAVETAGAPVRYGLDAQLAAKPGGLTYYKADTHWNGRGAWVASTAVCEALRQAGVDAQALPADAIEWREAMAAGDLGGKLEPPVQAETVLGRVREHRATLVADNRIRNHGRVISFEQPDPSLPRALIFGESFANPMLPFLKESFSQLTFAHSRWFDYRLIARERPDAVIWLPVERFLLEVPSDRGAARKLATLRARKRLRGNTAGTPGEDGSHFLAGIPAANQPT